MAVGSGRRPLSALKRLTRAITGAVGLNVRYQVTPGICVLGLNLFRDSRHGPPRRLAAYALDEVLRLRPTSVLDVGSGEGYHAKVFADAGAQVTCVDYGTSVYARSSSIEGLKVVHCDFSTYTPPPEKFNLVWASHVLEHQRNIGAFIEHLVNCCAEGGYVCITVPDPHRKLWGGHVTLWSPGLLAYNIALCGLDISSSRFIRGTNEFSILFSPLRRQLPPLTFDSGDLNLLKDFLPGSFRENSDPWKEW